MTFQVVVAKINQERLANLQRVKPIIKKESRAERLMLLIYENQQKLIDAKRKPKRKWYQIFGKK